MQGKKMFKRKIFDKLLEWKRESGGKTALLITQMWFVNTIQSSSSISAS